MDMGKRMLHGGRMQSRTRELKGGMNQRKKKWKYNRWNRYSGLGLIILLLTCILLSGCVHEDKNTENTKVPTWQDSPQPSADNILKDAEKMGYKQNEMEEVPVGYFQTCGKKGTIETLEYDSKDYTDSGQNCKKQAKVYLPYGYEETKTYPVFYLMHGGGDDEKWYFGETDQTSNSFMGCLLDQMMAGGELQPCIVCTPTYKNEYCQEDSKCTEVFYQELVSDLIPALEGKYATAYRQISLENKTTEEAERATRLCRGFGGFSMGSLTTWNVFKHALQEVGFFMPISGEDWGVRDNSEKQAELLSASVEEQKVSSEDFRLFAGCGGESDLAYQGMTAMLDAMKEQSQSFHYTEDFSEGNFYYASWGNGGHDVRTVCTVVYNGLPQFFEQEEDYLKTWANSILVEKLPGKICQKEEYVDYGKWVTKSYYSTTAERKTNVNVLLPAYYDKERTYPVLYLLHGYYDDEYWMKDMTELRQIMGNMMASGMIKEMIVVCPYIFCSKDQEKCTEMNLENSLAYDNFVNDLETDVMPFIEKTFAVATGRENTAIAGFSMGGRESLYIGITHPEQFGYIGAVCPAPGLTPGTDTKQHPGQLLEKEVAFADDQKIPRLIYLAGAAEDQMVGDTPAEIHELLERNSVDHVWQLFKGVGHDKNSVEVYLYHYLQMVFK